MDRGLSGYAAYRYARLRLGFFVFWHCFVRDRIDNTRKALKGLLWPN